MNADGSGQTALTTGGWDELGSVWSPDGTRIAFAGDRGGDWDMYTANPLGREVRRLSVGTAVDVLPDWQRIPVILPPPVPMAPPPPAATGNARLAGSLFAWTVQLLAEGSVLKNAAERSFAAIEAAAKRFRSFALRARRSLAAAGPESQRGRRVQKEREASAEACRNRLRVFCKVRPRVNACSPGRAARATQEAHTGA
jgi:WD40-like Beta Propeller Repeat